MHVKYLCYKLSKLKKKKNLNNTLASQESGLCKSNRKSKLVKKKRDVSYRTESRQRED